MGKGFDKIIIIYQLFETSQQIGDKKPHCPICGEVEIQKVVISILARPGAPKNWAFWSDQHV